MVPFNLALTMIRITKHVDYGIVLLSCLAGGEPGASLSSKELAAETHLPVPMVSKILKALGRNGFLESHRGAKGGYRLARPPEQISVLELVRALDGPVQITQCSSDQSEDCHIEYRCPVSGRWQKINEAIINSLQGISLADMLSTGTTCPGKSDRYQEVIQTGVL